MAVSDDESSDSSNEFLVNPNKLNLNDSFFNNAASTSKQQQQQSTTKSASNDDSSDDDFIDVDTNVDTTTLFTEVMKNLEKSNAAMATCFEQMPSTLLLTPSKTKAADNKAHQQSADLKDEINDLLLKGESGLGSSVTNDSDDDRDQPAPTNDSTSKEDISIILPNTNLLFNRRKKGQVDVQAQLIRRLNQKLQSNQLLVHKVGLLCWLSHGFHLNQIINNPEIMATTLSLVPSKIYPKGRVDIKYVEGFTNWFRKCIKVEFDKHNDPITEETLLERLKQQKTTNYRELVLLFIAALRAMGINCRLVVSLCPPAMKLKRDKLFQVKKEGDEGKPEKPRKTIPKPKRRRVSDERSKKKEDHCVVKNSSKADIAAKEEAKKRAIEFLRSNFQAPAKKKLPKDGVIVETDDVKVSPKVTRSRAKSMASLPAKADDNEKESTSKTTRSRARAAAKQDDAKSHAKKKKDASEVKVESGSEEKTVAEMSEASLEDESPSEDSDSEHFQKKRKLGIQAKKRSSESNSRKVLSSDDEEEELIDARDARYLWVEVYVESEESWISVSVPDNKVHCVSDIYKKAPTPVLYIIAWNSGGSIKDVTRRYCPHWLTVTRKQRIDETWWRETLAPWLEANSVQSRAEDEMLLQMEMEQPLPDSVAKYKGHPLYVLVRHLLKYEALYPPDCVPIGHLKNKEAVYSRHCVHTLRSRETWLKEARIVKPKQEPYKIVKSMPKMDKFTGQVAREPLELFGKWQTVPYDPPVAKDGVVPRNAYGNVDLFQQCMLPIGTVHIDLPGLGRVAKKLNIDCAAAVVGFNFGCRGAIPKTEGFVVCEEFEETLRVAWEAEQVAATKRAIEKRDKRIWGSWRRLIRGLFIKEKLALRYNMNEEEDEEEGVDKDGDKDRGNGGKDVAHKRKRMKKT